MMPCAPTTTHGSWLNDAAAAASCFMIACQYCFSSVINALRRSVLVAMGGASLSAVSTARATSVPDQQ